jgi:hypothetical protein
MLNSCEVQPQARMGLFRSYVRLLGMIHTDLDMYGPVHESTGPSSIAQLGIREAPPFRSITLLKVAALV